MRNPKKLFIAFALTMSMSGIAFSQAPAPPSNLVASDTPDDAGESIDLEWTLSPNDVFNTLLADTQATDANLIVASYVISRMTVDSNGDEIDEEDSTWRNVSESAPGETEWTDRSVELGWTYNYRIHAVDTKGNVSTWAELETTVSPVMQMFNMSKAWLAIFMLLFGGFVAYFINHARSGKKLWVRKIAGLYAIDEAVGRATEMGRPVLFVAGIQDINEIQTLAGLTVLSRVAKTAAEYGAQIEVPTCRSLVMAAARETVEAAYLAAGAPDSYQPDRIHYLTDEQFAFVAGVTGYMVREEPAACLYMGGFYAESLILAETGNHIGAIQVAGTAMPSQLPFFVASCDYTLIGEEFFAASAYLSGDPLQIGSLKGQDYGKFLSVLILIVGIFVATLISLSSWNHLRNVESTVLAAIVDETFVGPTLEELKSDALSLFPQEDSNPIEISSRLPWLFSNQHATVTESNILVVMELDAQINVGTINGEDVSFDSVEELVTYLHQVTKSDNWRFMNNPNTLELLQVVNKSLSEEYPEIASDINQLCSDYKSFGSLENFVYGLANLTVQEGSESHTLKYIRDNMLGDEGLGSFGSGNTDVEGDDS